MAKGSRKGVAGGKAAPAHAAGIKNQSPSRGKAPRASEPTEGGVPQGGKAGPGIGR